MPQLEACAERRLLAMSEARFRCLLPWADVVNGQREGMCLGACRVHASAQPCHWSPCSLPRSVILSTALASLGLLMHAQLMVLMLELGGLVRDGDEAVPRAFDVHHQRERALIVAPQVADVEPIRGRIEKNAASMPACSGTYTIAWLNC